VAAYGCESWTIKKEEEKQLEAFEMKGLREIMRVHWTAKKTNEWVLENAHMQRQLLTSVKARKLRYYGHL
jgi:predicted transposase YbfD/YdcC